MGCGLRGRSNAREAAANFVMRNWLNAAAIGVFHASDYCSVPEVLRRFVLGMIATFDQGTGWFRAVCQREFRGFLQKFTFFSAPARHDVPKTAERAGSTRIAGPAQAFLGEASLSWVERDESYGLVKAAASRRTPYGCRFAWFLAEPLAYRTWAVKPRRLGRGYRASLCFAFLFKSAPCKRPTGGQLKRNAC
jgi:hypothetical protein